MFTNRLLRPLVRIGTIRHSSTNFQYCLNLVKTNDFDSYLTTLIAPQEILRASFAVKAFSLEISTIGKSSIDTRIGEARIFYWKDQIDKIFQSIKSGKPIGINDPISQELYLISKSCNLNKAWFSRLIESKKSFLTIQQLKTVDELEKMADSSNVSYILFNCLNIKNVDCDHAANHIGKAQLLCHVTQNILKKPSQIVYYLPGDLLIKHKISQQDLFNFSERVLRPKRQNLKDLAFDLCTRANEHLKCARNLSSKIPAKAKPVLAASISCEVFLNKMQKYDFDLMDPKINSQFKATFLTKLILAKFRNTY